MIDRVAEARDWLPQSGEHIPVRSLQAEMVIAINHVRALLDEIDTQDAEIRRLQKMNEEVFHNVTASISKPEVMRRKMVYWTIKNVADSPVTRKGG